MTDDTLVPILIRGSEVARVRLAPLHYDESKRREINMGLGVVQLPSLLERFRPEEPTPPQVRFLLLVEAFCTAMNGGRRSQLDENDLTRLYMQTHGPGAFLTHQVRRASGDMICGVCQKTYYRHKMELALLDPKGEPFVNRLCNGDLVKL